ncbi:MAG: hypothetical protein ACE5NG_05115, partial [bacterium]
METKPVLTTTRVDRSTRDRDVDDKTITFTKSLSRLAQALLNQGIINEDMIQRATAIQSREPRKAKRKIVNILTDDLNVDRNAIYTEIARLYGFQIINLNKESIDRDRIEFIKEIIYSLPEALYNQLLSKRILPYKWHDYKRNVLVLVTPDPTDQDVHELAKKLDIADFEVAYAPLEDLEALIHEV